MADSKKEISMTFPWWKDEHIQLALDVEEFVNGKFLENDEAIWRKEIPKTIIKDASKKGWFGVFIPQDYGGLGLGVTGASIVAEGLSRLSYAAEVCPSITVFGGTRQVLQYGNENQRTRFLPKIARGEMIGAIVITEPYAGSDAADIGLTAQREGDSYILNGKKRFISNAGIADMYMVYAKTSDSQEDRSKYKHLSGFLVEANKSGPQVERINELCGYDSSFNGVLDFNDVRVPAENRISEEGDGWRIMVAGLNVERTLGSAGFLGPMRESIRYAMWHTQHRVQFNQPVSEFQNTQFKIADMIMKYKTSRLMTYYTSYLLDQGRTDLAPIEAAISKSFNSEALQEISENAIQLMGGDGCTKFYPIERHWRQSRITSIFVGTNEILRLLVYKTAKRLMNEELKPPRRYIHKELQVPVDRGTLKQPMLSKFSSDNKKDKILELLAEYYRINPGLFMSIEELEEEIGDKDGILETIKVLENEKLIKTYSDRKGLRLIRPTFDGLKKARPPEYYRWHPDWIKNNEDCFKLTF